MIKASTAATSAWAVSAVLASQVLEAPSLEFNPAADHADVDVVGVAVLIAIQPMDDERETRKYRSNFR
jgi:hypothetical protein